MGLVREWDCSGDKMIKRRVSGPAKCEILITGLITSFLAFVKRVNPKDNVKKELEIFQGQSRKWRPWAPFERSKILICYDALTQFSFWLNWGSTFPQNIHKIHFLKCKIQPTNWTLYCKCCLLLEDLKKTTILPECQFHCI